jgi:hypothetical protein
LTIHDSNTITFPSPLTPCTRSRQLCSVSHDVMSPAQRVRGEDMLVSWPTLSSTLCSVYVYCRRVGVHVASKMASVGSNFIHILATHKMALIWELYSSTRYAEIRFKWRNYIFVRGSVVGWGTMLQLEGRGFQSRWGGFSQLT